MSRFQKGQSGNPGGKAKKKVRTVVDGVEGEFTEFEIFAPAISKAAQVFLEVLADEKAARSDRLKAAEYVTNRVFGKPRQALELSGPDGGPMQHEAADSNLSGLTLEELRQLEAIRGKLEQSPSALSDPEGTC